VALRIGDFKFWRRWHEANIELLRCH
jgi:hypothetical protein